MTPGEMAGQIEAAEVERVARALVRRQIEINRRWDTPAKRLAEMIDRAVDYAWPERIEDAKVAITALRALQDAAPRAMDPQNG